MSHGWLRVFASLGFQPTGEGQVPRNPGLIANDAAAASPPSQAAGDVIRVEFVAVDGEKPDNGAHQPRKLGNVG